jgi:maleylpyruvate isomerase
VRPQADIDACGATHARMAQVLAAVDDDNARRPSRLPGWTVAHVIAHLARNAESSCRRIDALARDELVEQYAGGAAGRAAQIEQSATRPGAALVADAIAWSDRLDAMFATTPDDWWERPVMSGSLSQHPLSLLPSRRWAEVEVHLVDLDVGYSPRDWPDELVNRFLPRLLNGLANRTDPHALMAWTMGRGAAPELGPWG